MFKLQLLQKIIAQTFIAEITQINDQDCCHKMANNPSLGKILDSGTNRAISRSTNHLLLEIANHGFCLSARNQSSSDEVLGGNGVQTSLSRF